MLRAATFTARRTVPSVRYFSVGDAGGTWRDQQRAREEQYFNQVNIEQRKAFAEKLHAKELRELLEIVGEKHSLTQDQIHKLLEWKHEL